MENKLNLKFRYLTEDELVMTLKQVEKKLFIIFKKHIGKENSISQYDLFLEVYQIKPEEVEIFKRYFWWNVLKDCLRKLRNEGKLFVVSKQSSGLYVLSTKDELLSYERRIDTIINGLYKVKTKAKKWVNEKRFKKL
jgi:hypothetical protein